MKMKNCISILFVSLLAFTACKQEKKEKEETTTEETKASDHYPRKTGGVTCLCGCGFTNG